MVGPCGLEPQTSTVSIVWSEKALLHLSALISASALEKAFPNGTYSPCGSSFSPVQFRRQCLRN